MPQGGRYSLSRFAKIRLQSAAHFESGKFFILPSAASPSFCSGATYLIFIRTIEALRARGELHLDFATLDQLIIRDQHDGEGIWGRWNANGPGTARLFSIPTWHLSSEDAPASPRRRKNAVYKQRAKANEQKNANHQ